MKIDRARMRKTTSEVPLECRQLIERLQACSQAELLEELSKIHTWTFGKCELFHWAPVLDIFDSILEEAADSEEDNKWALYCDIHYTNTEKNLLLWILHFSTLLIEHSFSRHLYNSMEHLLVLLQSNDMAVVLGVLNLFYMFSKRSNFITRLKAEEKSTLTSRLLNLAENWGGKENGFGLADCCDVDKTVAPSATTLHVEFHKEDPDNKDKKDGKCVPNIIHIEHVDKLHKTPAEIMKSLIGLYYVPPGKEMWLFTHVRLAHHFADYRSRLLCVQARLQALSVLVYSNSIQDSPHNLLYNGILDELVELVELSHIHLVEIRSAALRTLTAIIHLDRSPHIAKKPGSRLHNIIDVTGASQYHGFLPVLVRSCIAILTNQNNDSSSPIKTLRNVVNISSEHYSEPSKTTQKPVSFESTEENSNSMKVEEYVADVLLALDNQFPNDRTQFPLPLATALFSFLYHLASYEAGGEALVSCGMMESLLQVINWHGVELEHITFVTRAVRVIDLITNIDMQAFQTHGGLLSFINRLNVEVKLCQKDQLYELKVAIVDAIEEASPGPSETNTSTNDGDPLSVELEHIPENVGKTCLPQRAALLKSMLNFLKKALQDNTFSDNIRHLMEGTLPNSLKNIIANAEYYGPSLFLLATDVVTVYVYQEPSLLSALQDNGLTDVVLHALLVKEVPSTREVLGSLPNVFSALCLNNRGLQSFVKCKPFEKFFKVLLMPSYLPAMRRRRSSEPMADTACNLGNAMDELMRHQPSLKSDATKAIVNLLQELVHLGTDPKYVCWRPHSKTEVSPSITSRNSSNAEGSSDEEDDEEEEASTSSQNGQTEAQIQGNSERKPIALVDYILNIMKFIDAILSNNSTDDHCREFVIQDGLPHLLKILGLPNLPVDCPATNPAQAVATVCKSILNLAHEPQLFKEGLSQLSGVLTILKPLYSKLDVPGGSKLLLELASASNAESAFSTASTTPLLHAMGAAHGYVIMFVHVCRTGQSEIRNLSLQHWGVQEGITVLKGLSELYTSLVWESTLLLAYCSEDLMPSDCNFPREELEKLHSFFDRCDSTNTSDTTGNVASAMEALTTNPPPVTMDVDTDLTQMNKPSNHNIKYIKPLLGSSSRLGRALAELFGLLVKLSVGSPIRQRRGQNIVAAPPLPSPFARNVATALSMLLADGLDWEKLPPCPTPKCRLTFLICSVGFTSPMLFDEKRYPYHLMLKKFVERGGQTTFFKTFQWALSAGGTIPLDKGLEHPNLPEGTGGFLDAWLMLLEKMVNPKAILESPHTISSRSTNTTSPHDCTFDPVKYLIQIHKLAFESILLMWGKKPLPTYGTRMTESMLTIFKHILKGEKIIKDKLKTEETKIETPSSSAAPATTSSLLSTRETDVNNDNLRQLMDMGFSREHALEALLHTISLEQATDYLLSNPPLARVNQSMDVDLEDDQVMQAIAISLGCSNSETAKKKEVTDDSQPLSENLIENFTQNCLQICLRLVKVIPECVHKVCELLVTITKRNGRVYRDNLLDSLVVEIYSNAVAVCVMCSGDISQADYTIMLESLYSHQLAQFTHLYILFFEVSSYFEMKIPCANAIFRKEEFLSVMIKLVSSIQAIMYKISTIPEPKWLATIILLVDEISKVSLCSERKELMHRSTSRTWRWFDLVSGKWTPYSTSNNKLINDAYWNGEQSIRVNCGRRRYTATFSNMLQMNDESGNNRPISMTLASLSHPSCTDLTKPALSEPTKTVLTEKEESKCVIFPNLDQAQKREMVRACVKFMHLPIDKDLLHSVMQICVRLTRSYELAKVFVEQGGIKCLLHMRHINEFGGYGILATILIKHALEEPNTLSYAIEKVIRGRTLTTIPPSYKELVYLVRQIGGAVTRCPETFLEVAKNILRVDIAAYRTDEVDIRLPVRADLPTRTKAPILEERSSNEVVCDLLDALLKPLEVVTEGKPISKSLSGTSTSTQSSETTTPEKAAAAASSTSQTESSETKTAEPTTVKIKPMLPKSIILKILADAVVSYGPVAKIVTDYIYPLDNSTVLSFVFDKILPEVTNISDSECSSMCRMLIAALASSNHSPEAQSTLVTEVKAALSRALLLPESTEKHTQIQHICGIISTMIENCPPSQVRVKNQQPNGQMNNIVKLMIRKGLFNDLARVPHYLDLSSPNTSFTGNACLKPLEALSRIVNQPVPASVQAKKKNLHSTDDNTGFQSGTTSTEGTNAQGEETIEDTENTEQDVSAVASSLEAANVESTENDNVLEEIMEQLLDQGNTTDVSSNRNHSMDIDDHGNIFDHERDATEELMSTDSGDTDSNASDQAEDEDNEDNEVDDENIDETDENDDNNYDDEEGIGERRRASSHGDNDDDILMIHYTNAEHDFLPRVRWNENGFAIPIFDETNTNSEQSGSIIHPLLMSRNNAESSSSTITRTQRANRARRYQYLFNPRNPNPPVILQRLLGPHDSHITMGTNNILGGTQDMRESARVVVMDNFGLLPTHEEQIDFVDQSGYLFGPSLAATLNHVPPVLHWWNIESRCLDLESVYDTTTHICNELIPNLIKYRNIELLEKKKVKTDEEKTKHSRKQKLSIQSDETSQEPVPINFFDSPREPSSIDHIREPPLNIDTSPDPQLLLDFDEPSRDAPPSQQSRRRLYDPRNVEGLYGVSIDEDLTNTVNSDSQANTNSSEDTDIIRPSVDLTRNSGTDMTEPPSADTDDSEGASNMFEMPNLNSSIIRNRCDVVMAGPMGNLPIGNFSNPITENADQEEDDRDRRERQSSDSIFFCRRRHNLRTLFEEALNQQIASLSNAYHNEENVTENTNQSTQTGEAADNNAASGDVVMSEPGPSTVPSDEVPDGVDPSFLAAIPPEMRREVLEQHRMLNIQQRIATTRTALLEHTTSGPSTEVSPEFLAALPPALQEEVLTQQRLEQQRQAASRANPNEPVDAGAFFDTLQPSLRTMILSDMEDSQMSALPPDLAAEAQNLRRDLEARNRQMVQERFLQNNLTTIIRHSTRGRMSTRPSTFLPQRAHWSSWGRDLMSNSISQASNMKIRGRQLLDHEGLSCLLVLLFTDDPHLNKLRLHRVIRNLCFHGPTREWVVNALLSVIDRSVHTKPDESANKPSRKLPKPGPLSSKLMTDAKLLQSGGNWLNIRMEAALGCSANIFIVTKGPSKRSERSAIASISIHPQAAPIICKNALELLISLSKAFPASLLPLKALKDDDKNMISPVRVRSDNTSDFWEVLLKLDSASTKKGKSIAKSTTTLTSESDSVVSFEQSVFGQLLYMLSSPVINKNTQLTDNLLRLLSVITSSMPELSKPQSNSKSKTKIQKFESFPTPTQAINLAVNVITYKSCSEEGLEYITNLLLNLATASLEMSFLILNLLLSGAKRIGDIVREQIQKMLKDLMNMNSIQKRKVIDESSSSTSKGTIPNRFTKETVIITASTKVKTSCELQLPSMVPLTSKSSSQVFFLRVLRVIVNIRHSIKQSMKHGESTSLFQDLLALSDQLGNLDSLWDTLSQCLLELEHTPDHHAVLVLQPAVEAFFLVHSPQQGVTKMKETPATSEEDQSSQEPPATDANAASLPQAGNSGTEANNSLPGNEGELQTLESQTKAAVPPEQLRFLNFAEKHRTVLNQILRQSTAHLADGPFAVLVDHTRILDFDIKRRYFRTELERMDQGIRREETAVHVRRSHIFEDSFRELYRRTPEEWKNRFYIVFEEEEGQDAGGLLREWYVIISRDIFNPMYALFTVSPGDRVTYMINSASHYNPNHLCYYKFVGRVIAKAIYDNKLLECYFTRSFYKHILGIPVKYTDMESEDYSFYNSLVYIIENNISNLGLDLTFSTEINEFGVTETRDLIPNGRNVPVTEENKMEYIRLSCQMKMTGAIKQQLNAFLEGFYDIIPMRLISIFNEQELELLISGLPNVDIDDLKSNTEYHKYQANSLQIQWFWRALRAFDQADRAKFLQFVTGTSKVPLQGFAALEGMNGVQRFQIHRDDRSTDRLPSAHTCFNQLDLPVYETYDKLKSYLLKAIHECSEGFGFA